MRCAWSLLAALMLAGPAGLAASEKQDEGRPDFKIRALPRIANAPVNVVVTAELVGGSSVEDFYCPELVWDWGDGTRSARESDCAPFEDDAAIQRRFSARHVYRTGGLHKVKLTLYKARRRIATASTRIRVRTVPGASTPRGMRLR